jgi:hypothetical protein
VFWAYLGLCALALAALAVIPETVRNPDKVISLRPRLGAPPSMRAVVLGACLPLGGGQAGQLGWTPHTIVRLDVCGGISGGPAGDNQGATMQLTRQHVVDVLRRTGFAEVAEDASRTLPDPVELDDVLLFLVPFGITRDLLISEMGGSP